MRYFNQLKYLSPPDVPHLIIIQSFQRRKLEAEKNKQLKKKQKKQKKYNKKRKRKDVTEEIKHY